MVPKVLLVFLTSVKCARRGRCFGARFELDLQEVNEVPERRVFLFVGDSVVVRVREILNDQWKLRDHLVGIHES